MNRILLLLFLTTFSAFAQVPPVLRNKFSTNDDVRPIVGGILFTNPVAGGGWILFDSGGLAVFDKNGQENGRIFGVSTGGIAMEFGGTFSGLFTNGTMLIHTRDGAQNVISSVGDFTSQTGFLFAGYTNSGTAQYVFTVDAGGSIYSRQLLSYRFLYANGSSNIISADSAALSYLANTVQVNFASSPYQTFQMTNDTVFTNQNQAVGRAVAVKMIGGLTNCNLGFPSGWVFLGSPAPASITSNKTAILSLTAFGTDPTNVMAVYAVQP